MHRLYLPRRKQGGGAANPAWAADIFASVGPAGAANAPQPRNFFVALALHKSCLAGTIAPALWGIQMKKTKVRTAALPAGLSVRLHLSAAAIILALLAAPHLGRAQGIVRGAQEGAYEGNRIAGPVGGVVGGAVGAGVGGAVGAVKGVFGIPDGGWRRGHGCRGYYERHGHFRCYG
jgi:hypothetical protein